MCWYDQDGDVNHFYAYINDHVIDMFLRWFYEGYDIIAGQIFPIVL